MKKFLSMVMAAAMTLSLVPATAFAADGVDLSATASIVGSESFVEGNVKTTTAEAQLKVTNSQYTGTAGTPDITFTLVLDNATFDGIDATDNSVKTFNVRYYDAITATWSPLSQTTNAADTAESFYVAAQGDNQDEIDISIKGKEIKKNDIVAVTLTTTLDKTGNGKSAKVSVESDDITISNGTDLTYATVGQIGFTASVRKTVDIAVDEVQTIEDVTIKPSIGNTFPSTFIAAGDEVTVRVNGGFEFTRASQNATMKTGDDKTAATFKSFDTDELVFTATSDFVNADKVVLSGVELDAADAKEGATATLKIYVPKSDSQSVEVAKVIGNAVTISVDEDADVPVFYSGTDLDNTGITDYTEHKSLEVTIKESFPGAWNVAKDWTLTLPEGVYAVEYSNGDGMIVANSTIEDGGNVMTSSQIESWFEGAYDNGDYDNFTFKKRTWDVTDPTDNDDASEFSFKLYLVADPNFEGDVTLTMEGEAVDTQTVTIAKFVKPYTVEASQNDLQIDYRNTEVGSNIVIKEPETGLWKKDTQIAVSLDKIEFDSGATVTVDEKSGMEVKNVKTNNGVITFTVDKVSTDEPATITVSDLDLYMDRSLPAGKYDLSVYSPTMLGSDTVGDNSSNAIGYLDQKVLGGTEIIDNFTDRFYDTTVKEGFINIITAGREDSESFTTKLVIPIGSTTMTAGENQITLDAPAYISADGYTMLPLRAVATALGIPNESVMWDGATRTVTIMYGSKVIVMTVGQKTMYLSGSPVPASAAPEITNDRTFLPVRDLGTALGVSDLTWDTDPATGKVSTVYVNANK